MGRDPYSQREDERRQEDDDYAAALTEEQFDRAREQSDPEAVRAARRTLKRNAEIAGGEHA